MLLFLSMRPLAVYEHITPTESREALYVDEQ
jgi:hypothetical protein